MDPILLRTLVAVADGGSFSAGAAALNCVQSNVTTRVKRLEAQLGAPLFERGRGGARLTPIGRSAYAVATEAIAQLDRAERALLELADGAAPLRLGSMETTAAARLPTLLKGLRAARPKARISLTTGPTGALITKLWRREIDAAFVAAPVDPDRFVAIPAFDERLQVIRASEAPEHDALLAFARGCSYRAVAEAWLRQIGRLDVDVVEMGTLEGILGCVEAGMGFAVAPAAAVAACRPHAGLIAEDLPAPFGATQTVLAARRDAPASRAYDALVALLGAAADGVDPSASAP